MSLISSHREAYDTPLVKIEVGKDAEPVGGIEDDEVDRSTEGSTEDNEAESCVTGNKRIFHMRKGVLCFYSGYFEAALNGRFSEAQENVCRLPDEDPLIFAMFEHYVHTRVLYASTLEPALLLSYLVGRPLLVVRC